MATAHDKKNQAGAIVPNTDERHTITVVCTGRTVLKGGTIGVKMRIVQADGTLGKEDRHFEAKKMNMRAGQMYTVDAPDTEMNQVYTTSLAWKGAWPDKKERLFWQAQEQAFETARQAARDQAKEEKRNLVREQLEPLRLAWQATNMAGRVSLEAQVLAYLRYGTPGLDAFKRED